MDILQHVVVVVVAIVMGVVVVICGLMFTFIFSVVLLLQEVLLHQQVRVL